MGDAIDLKRGEDKGTGKRTKMWTIAFRTSRMPSLCRLSREQRPPFHCVCGRLRPVYQKLKAGEPINTVGGRLPATTTAAQILTLKHGLARTQRQLAMHYRSLRILTLASESRKPATHPRQRSRAYLQTPQISTELSEEVFLPSHHLALRTLRTYVDPESVSKI